MSETFYREAIDLSDASALEAELQALLNTPIYSAAELETWLKSEVVFSMRCEEVLAGHTVDFYRDTNNEEKKKIHLYDQSEIQPLLIKYSAEFDRKVCESPFINELDERKYGLMKKVRSTNLNLFREENLPLQVREQELVTEYNALVGGLLVEWDGGTKPLPFVQAQLDNPDRAVRERAWKSTAKARQSIKSDVDRIMDELVQLRHQIARNAGFENYRDYAFRDRNREYSVDDCRRFHAAVEKFIVPVWDEVAQDLRKELGADTYRPWDQSSCTISAPPFQEVRELETGVERMLRRTDDEFAEIFLNMQERHLLDLEGRQGKAPGGFCIGLGVSRSSFVFANFSPSYFALIALVHEMGHAINASYQLRKEPEWMSLRAEIAELYSHGMELLSLDKLDEFYPDQKERQAAVRERLRRSLNMLMGPLSGDLFQHWMYEHPDHTVAERDAAYHDIAKRYAAHPVDWSGYEDELGAQWAASIHFVAYPFYNIEYSMAELGALQLMQQYQEDPTDAIANYKRGSSADYNLSIAEVYAETGVSFDFSDHAIENAANFLRHLWKTLG